MRTLPPAALPSVRKAVWGDTRRSHNDDDDQVDDDRMADERVADERVDDEPVAQQPTDGSEKNGAAQEDELNVPSADEVQRLRKKGRLWFQSLLLLLYSFLSMPVHLLAHDCSPCADVVRQLSILQETLNGMRPNMAAVAKWREKADE